MAAPSNSIYDLKKGFLSSQLRILSTPLEPPRNWQDKTPEGEAGDLPENSIVHALYKFNVVAKRHQKLIYSTQALCHVAEQIDDLYHKKSDPVDGVTTEEDVLRRGADLKDPQNIEILPESYPSSSTQESEEDLEQYQNLKAKLSNLSTALQVQRQRHAYYAQLKQLVEPFREPQVSVQPNLVTRDGQLQVELERMRMLASKLAFQIERANLGEVGGREGEGDGEGEGEGEGDEDEDMDMDMNMERRLKRILGGS